MTSPPSAIGNNRLTWQQLPAPIQREITHAAGAAVVEADSRPGGFSPGLASVLRLADGRSVFVKAVNAARNPDTPAMHRQEARVLAALPDTAPAPRLRWSYDDGDWVALMIDAVDGHPPAQPWHAEELAAYLAVAEQVAELPAAGLPVPPAEAAYAKLFTGWRRLAGQPALDDLDPWARQRLDQLVAWEQAAPQATAGDALLHGDLRGDNVLLTADGGAMVVDWPHASAGAAWADVLLGLPSIAMHGGGDPQEHWRRFPPARHADPDQVNAVLAAAVGFFLWQARQPPPPNLASVRPFQRAQGEAGLAWLQGRIS